MALRAVLDHPKFAHLKSLLKQPRGAVLGWLEGTWHFTGRFTPQGNIGKYSDLAIESWLEWDGEKGKLIDALMKSGWLDVDETHRLIVHDWSQHADKATRMALKRAKLEFCVPGVPENEHDVPTVFPRCENTVPENHEKCEKPGTVWGLPVPVPVPVPEPVKKTPPSRARNPEPQPSPPEEPGWDGDDPPPGLHGLQYAGWLLERRNIPAVPATLRSGAAAIETASRKYSKPPHEAVVLLDSLAAEAQARGQPVNKFWLEDPDKWEAKEAASGTNSANRHAKTGGNLNAAVEFARRRGIDLRRASEIGGSETGGDHRRDAGGLHGDPEVLPP